MPSEFSSDIERSHVSMASAHALRCSQVNVDLRWQRRPEVPRSSNLSDGSVASRVRDVSPRSARLARWTDFSACTPEDSPPPRRPESGNSAALLWPNAVLRVSPTTVRLGQKRIAPFTRPARDTESAAEQAKPCRPGMASRLTRLARLACAQREAEMRLEVERSRREAALASTMVLLETAAMQMEGADARVRTGAIAAQLAVALCGRVPRFDAYKYPFRVRV